MSGSVRLQQRSISPPTPLLTSASLGDISNMMMNWGCLTRVEFDKVPLLLERDFTFSKLYGASGCWPFDAVVWRLGKKSSVHVCDNGVEIAGADQHSIAFYRYDTDTGCCSASLWYVRWLCVVFSNLMFGLLFRRDREYSEIIVASSRN